mgnify:CR=1 FL=1
MLLISGRRQYLEWRFVRICGFEFSSIPIRQDHRATTMRYVSDQSINRPSNKLSLRGSYIFPYLI